MREFAIVDDDVLVGGAPIDTFLSALGPYRARGEKVVARNCGVDKISTKPSDFYPARPYMDALREFQEQFGQDFMENVGSLIFEKAVFPSDIRSAAEALAVLDVAYQMNHQNGEGKIGSYKWTPAPKGGRLVCDNPYPCAFDRGIVAGVLRRFNVKAQVRHDDPATCRHLGGERCTYVVEW